jgi:hypothetical protein
MEFGRHAILKKLCESVGVQISPRILLTCFREKIMLPIRDQINLEIRKIIGDNYKEWMNAPNSQFVNKRTNEVAAPKDLMEQGDFAPLWFFIGKNHGLNKRYN